MAETLDQAGLCWLLGDGPVRRKHATSEEFHLARDFARSAWQLSPTLVPRIRAWAPTAPTSDLASLESLSTATAALAAVQFTLSRRVGQALQSRDIPYCLLKGSAVRLTAYSDPSMRCGLDVDIAVPKDFLADAEEVIAKQGFRAGSLLEDGRHFRTVGAEEREAVESQHYELACLVRHQRLVGVAPDVRDAIISSLPILRPWHELPDGDVGCYISLDVHHGICLDITVDDMISTARPVQSKGVKLLVPTVGWMLFHLVFKLYWEGVHNYRKGAYQYADLVRLLAVATEDDLHDLAKLLDHYLLSAAGFYTLRRLPSDFGVQLPPVLADFVRSNSRAPEGVFPSDVNDAGDMWPKIWGHR